tara:strand:+ start:71 stop:859 length:789 start_codon:yes stop_codon:yes gene_type:complete
MQNHRKSYQNVWILSGTADGPLLANKFLKLNYKVFVSVVSYKASQVYPLNNKLHIITGKLCNEKEVQEFIDHYQIKFIIDATHPFAVNISKLLLKSTKPIGLFIFRYQRVSRNKSKVRVVSDFKCLKTKEVKNKNILLAMGSRSLNEVAKYYIDCEANVFARIIATPESISYGLSSCIENSKLAILNPSKNKKDNLECYLCKYWNIDYILCRDSGGYSQMVWDDICLKSNISLILLRRPIVQESQFIFYKYNDLINKVLSLT